jgi:crotonobetainyl-CoA:carnitine CoA-transferase CaiB-like acyl-CoA transferase
VLKVEQPGVGDSLRALGEQASGFGLLWLQEARNKRSVTCNLRDPGGQQIIRDLVAAGYDTVLESFRPGTLERWGLGYEELAAVDPGVILARVSGYGQTGPARDKPGFARIAHAFAGLTYMAGYPDRPPVTPGTTTIADYLAGLFAAFGVLVAREHRVRTGRGQVVDVALYEAVFRILDSLAITYSVTGEVRERAGAATPLAAPHNHYPTADGKWLAIACTNDRIFVRLIEAIGTPALRDDPRFRTAADRVAHREALDQLVADWTSRAPMADLVRMLDAAEVPCSPINSIADVFADPQFRARATLLAAEHAVLGWLRMPTVIPRLSESPGAVAALGPDLGDHTDAVLRDVLGMRHAQIDELRNRGVI